MALSGCEHPVRPGVKTSCHFSPTSVCSCLYSDTLYLYLSGRADRNPYCGQMKTSRSSLTNAPNGHIFGGYEPHYSREPDQSIWKRRYRRHGARPRRPERRGGRVRRRHGPQRLREVDAAAPAGRPGPSQRGAGGDRRAADQRAIRRRPHQAAPAQDRLRLPVLQPDPGARRHRERGPAPDPGWRAARRRRWPKRKNGWRRWAWATG